MSSGSLAEAVFNFARITQSLSDSDLDRPWAWKDYDSEGVRFAFFRTFEDLRSLAAAIAHSRHAAGQPRTEAQYILGNYHTAFRDLQAVLVGKDKDAFDQPPAAGEWPVRRAIAHILGADMGFYVAIRYALDGHRTADGRPAMIPDEAWEIILGMSEEAQDRILDSKTDDLTAYHKAFHERVLADFAGITADELEIQSRYWEDEPFSLRFRLHRYESHIRQHTVQIEKTLAALGQHAGEAQRLLRWIYTALAEVEGITIGAPNLEANRQQAAAKIIDQRTQEVISALET